AKGEIFEGSEPGGTAIVPADSPHYARLRAKAERHAARVLGFGVSREAQVRSIDAVPAPGGGTLVTVDLGMRKSCYTIAMPGAHWVANSSAVMAAVEAVGGDLNAATSNETTAYYARVSKADVPSALDVLSDILANPSFDSEELEREKSVIEQEIGAAQDTPDDVIFEHLSELSYPDQPMGRSSLGTPQTLASFDRDNSNNYSTTHYRG
ncbi:hypothetical protein OY671_009471, partial [Metschnikowia pulcherrima]